ncbi:CvpA family protein [Ilyomonas limi]|uniref:CvpA family protein n=1 Tax=Ilyomonas limi TaxID=2575867 RepID=A0A4U3L1I4_9BACT|nr:CvpA family protein [Ilyomonas limi]TKK68858.1 CvpA family protein [Ilyomonas limi]
MIIDIIYLGLLALAVFKGFRNGFIIAVFSFFAVIIGLAAALKLSVVVAGWLGTNINVSARFLPVLAFVLVMVVVAWLVRLCGLLIQKALQIVMLGFINKAAGIILYAVLYTILLSVVLFYAKQINIIGQDAVAASYCYSFIQPWGPAAIQVFAMLIPAFKNMFQYLEHFFDNIAKKAA